MDPQLSDKIALVTGAARGIGRAIAVGLSKAGASVAINYLIADGQAEDLRSEIETAGGKCLLVKADVSVPSEVSIMVSKIQSELGNVSILVNNAGISRPQKIEDITENDWDTILTVNLKSMFLVTQAVLPKMRQQRWGRIINLSSVAAQLGGVIGPHYAASKAGALGLTHSYAALLAKEGITANAIAPALIETEMITSNPKATPDLIPLGRFGTVEEVADLAVMLARNGYITGQTFNINGGWYMS